VNGYIGAVLAPYLLKRGIDVLGLTPATTAMGGSIATIGTSLSPHTINKDLRDVTEGDLAGCNAVAHLAELSNDPLGQNNLKSHTRSIIVGRFC
jgi:nucleoside-diphosphate-sugar epimerase